MNKSASSLPEAAAPARTFTAKGMATRTRIISAAADLVFAHGVARTAIEDVQQLAGVSPSQMYHYFTDKNDLVRAVIARRHRAVRENAA